MKGFLFDRAASADPVAPAVLFAHGAGAPMDSHPMTSLAAGLAAAGCDVYRFEFPYMQERRTLGRRRPPDGKAHLLAYWRERIDTLRNHIAPERSLILAGKSMGGRMASLVADAAKAEGLLVFGYPFHPAGKPGQLRTEHLYSLTTPALFVQGGRDKLGDKEEVVGYRLSAHLRLIWLDDGDHDFKPRVKSGYTQTQHFQTAIAAAADFIHSLRSTA